MGTKKGLHLTKRQQEESLVKYADLYRQQLMEHVNWRKKHDNAMVLLKDEEYKQNLKDILAELDAVANAIIDNNPRLPIEE